MLSLITLRKHKLVKILKNKYQYMYIKLAMDIFSVKSIEFFSVKYELYSAFRAKPSIYKPSGLRL
jgi:hypothetical protein